MEARTGRQTPTTAFILPYEKTLGGDAIALYEKTNRTAFDWQKIMVNDLLAVDSDGLWVHQEFCYSIPRRNGKGEIITIRELYALEHGERVAHTAHLANTSSSAAYRLSELLKALGYREISRPKQGEDYSKAFKFDKLHGTESIYLFNSDGTYKDGKVNFRTRSGAGGLGEGYDVLIVDEAQEYTAEQQTALQYTVTDSKNPQVIMCGTPPTAVSKGDVFVAERKTILQGKGVDAAWMEWSIETYTEDVQNVALWYETNPSLGLSLTERAIRKEIKPDVPGNCSDFNIQRLGLWILTNQASVISADEWNDLKIDFAEYRKKLKGKLFVGIKYSKMGNTIMAICCKDADGGAFVEVIDCRQTKLGDFWLIQMLTELDYQTVVVDGSNGQTLLAIEMQRAKLKKPIMPKVIEIEQAHELFERAMADNRVHHAGQQSLTTSATNCIKRAIGSSGGWGYKSIKDGADIGLLEAVVLAFYGASTAKETKGRKTISY